MSAKNAANLAINYILKYDKIIVIIFHIITVLLYYLFKKQPSLLKIKVLHDAIRRTFFI